MDYRILGPLRVIDADRPIPLSGAKQRALLAMLLLEANHVVSSDRLIDRLWGDEPPETATTALQVYISRLRTALEPDRSPGDAGTIIITQPPGYILRAGPDELDLARFERLTAEAEAARLDGDPRRAAELLREALDLWDGTALADLAFETFAQAEIARLEALRLVAIEDRIDAELELGRHAHLVGELEGLVAEHPLRERLRCLLILALYRSGRQAEALDAYNEAKRTLLDELGIEPSPALARLERAILVQDPALDPPAAAEAPPAARVVVPEAQPPAEETQPSPAGPHETRKIVTVVFTDIAESTSLGEALDPERLRRVMGRYFDTVSHALERHGGTVEKFIGDAVLAVFGIPYLHEDDALRAVRAAVEARGALDLLNEELERDWGVRIQTRTGVNTGEVVAANGSPGGSFVTGRAVNVAARLEQTAPVGTILIGEDTYRLVRDAVEVEQLEPLELKGLSGAVPAFLLLDVFPDRLGRTRRRDAPLIGRERELRLIDDALGRAASDRASHMFTVLGTAGVGKSRLVEEFTRGLGSDTVVVRGRCLPYGEGITFWPLAEIVGAAAGLAEADSPADATRKVELLLEGEPDAAEVAGQLAEIVGLAEGELTTAQSFRTARRLLETLARADPLVVVLDDIHWAEPTFLDLIEHVAERARESTILLLCLARPELLEIRPGWAGGKSNATTILLEPLSERECERLVEALFADEALPPGTLERIAAAAEGNPLFVEQLIALFLEVGPEADYVTIPPTVHALLAARLDHLPADERSLLECAAVIGKVFEPDELEAIADAGDGIADLVVSLVRKELVRPGRASYPGSEAHRFRHLLIRDAAYEAIPKERRSRLHERYATWLERSTGERLRELEEIVGYHLEQAFRYRSELGPATTNDLVLAGRAAARLASAGTRAFARHDTPAAVSLLGRSVDLLPPDEPQRVGLLPDLGRALLEAGELARADGVLAEAIAAAEVSGDDRVRWQAVIERAALRFQIDETGSAEELVRVAEEAIPELERLQDSLGLAHAWHLVSDAHWSACRFGASGEALERALGYARRAGDRHIEAEILGGLAAALFFGPTPVPEAIGRCEALLDEARGDPGAEPTVLVTLAGLQGMAGELDAARQLYARGRAILEELGLRLRLAWITYVAGSIELLADDPLAAELNLRLGLEMLEEMGERDALPTQAAGLAEALYEQGRDEEAEQLTVFSEQTAAPEDNGSQVMWRLTRARISARRGDQAGAEQLAAEAVELAGCTDSIDLQARALHCRADVLAHGGSSEEAARAYREATRLYRDKGNAVLAARLEAAGVHTE